MALTDDAGGRRFALAAEVDVLPVHAVSVTGRLFEAGDRLELLLDRDGPRLTDRVLSLLVRVRTLVPPAWDAEAADAPTPADLRWTAVGPDGTEEDVDVIDGTGAFRRSGLLQVSWPEVWNRVGGQGCRLRAEAAAGAWSEPVLVDGVHANAVVARHQVPAEADLSGRLAALLPLPGQVLAVPGTAGLLMDGTGEAELLLDERDGVEHRWTSVSSRVAVGPADRVFVVDRVRGELRFGDGLAGRVPRPAEGGRCVVRYAVGGGVAGNLGDRGTWGQEDGSVSGGNPVPATGGADPEPVTAARQRAADALARPDRTVTEDDVRELALATPGVAVARAQVSPGHHPDHPCADVPTALTVTVVPGVDRTGTVGGWSDAWTPAPHPDRGLLAAVRERLATARLLGQEVFVGAPGYRGVRVWLTVSRSGRDEEVRRADRHRAAPTPRPARRRGRRRRLALRRHGPALRAARRRLPRRGGRGDHRPAGGGPGRRLRHRLLRAADRAPRPGAPGPGRGGLDDGRDRGEWAAVTWGRDVAAADLTMVPAPVPGGVEPRLLPEAREDVRGDVASRATAYTPEWTDRSPQDAGVALVRAHATMAAAVSVRMNRLPRRLALTGIDLAGVRARTGTPAAGLAGLTVADRATAPVGVPAGSVFLTPAGTDGPALETGHDLHALPGKVASVAVLSGGWTVLDDAADLRGLAPFGRRGTPPAELWWGIATPVAPAGLLGLAVLLTPAPGRATAASTSAGATPAVLRWEALTPTGPEELVVERDDTRGLTRDGVLLVRADTRAPWLSTTLPGRDADPPLVWLRARLVSGGFPTSVGLRTVTLNGVTVLARRTVRGEVADPVERRPTGRSTYRLSQVPVIPDSVTLDVAETAADPFAAVGTAAPWREVPTLTTADADDRVFTLDPALGLLTFGDGRHGRAVPAGYRNVVARSYAVGGGTAGLPHPGDTLSSERSVPGLTGATVLALTTGSDAETAGQLLVRGPAAVRSRLRAVAASDYATSALATSGVAVARAHCLPATDVRAGGAVVPGTLTVVVVPRVPDPGRLTAGPTPDAELLAAVADGLARHTGVLGATVVAVAPTYRDLAVTALLVGRPDADLSVLESTARDALDAWLSPLTGGAEGTGWPFGGTVRWDVAVRMLLSAVPGLLAVSRLSFRVGHRRLPVCTDVPLAADELVLPGGHVLETVTGEA